MMALLAHLFAPSIGDRRRKTATLFLAIAATGLLSISCGLVQRLSVPVTPIATAVESSDGTDKFYIRGTVINRVAILGQGLYEVEDDSGTVWVVTQGEVPALNSTVTVKGTVEGLLKLGGRNFGVTVKEIERL
ncbi:MAG: hypothetical protein AB4040_20860 [Synechococcus sp.]